MIAHESISQFFAFLFTVCLFAIFGLYQVFLKGKYVRFVGQSEEKVYTEIEQVVGFFVLTILIFLKNMIFERGVMKRFAEDFDQTIHTPYFGLFRNKNLCAGD